MTIYHIDSRAKIETECIPPEITCIVSYGYSSVGDGGGGLYIVSPTEPAHAGKVQSLNGIWWELREDKPHVQQFGGIDDGITTDDTNAFERLSNYSNIKELCAFIRPTKNGFATNGGHIFNHGLCGEGNGWGCRINITHPSNTIIRSEHQIGAPFRGIHYLSSVVRIGGAYIWIDAPPGTVCYKPDISENVFQGGFFDIVLNRPTIATIEDNFSTDFHSNFLVIQNADFPDNGDHSISGNTWDTSISTAGAGIVQYNAGGARISNNKGGRGFFAYELCLTGTASESTSVLTICNNSFENQIHGIIRLRRYPGASATFGKIVIDGNEFSSNILDNPAIQLDDGQNFIDNIVVTDNIIQFPVVGIAAYAAKKIMIGGNTLRSFNGSSVGILCDVNSSGTIDKNTYHNVTTPVVNASPNITIT